MAVLERLSRFVGQDLTFKSEKARGRAEAGLQSNSKSQGQPEEQIMKSLDEYFSKSSQVRWRLPLVAMRITMRSSPPTNVAMPCTLLYRNFWIY
jgi:hypothetical protein